MDEVRLSRGARYAGKFMPAKRLARDATTVLALANDQAFGPFVPVAANEQFQAKIRGNARVLNEAR